MKPPTKTILLILLVTLISSCSPYQQINKRTDKLYNALLGKWEVNKRSLNLVITWSGKETYPEAL
ncbi:hypothetical protein [Niabella hibiscisoli]|uniref:hypothetical protein n=1 Tax=Niabella hibiscisoli TaxID=1825928 RepID=UPI001F0DE119|nr:hypothetical protein [Niabella hibiscisoli]MCH5720643.1 hypothetical protein [Niabella hibiscisoli]